MAAASIARKKCRTLYYDGFPTQLFTHNLVHIVDLLMDMLFVVKPVARPSSSGKKPLAPNQGTDNDDSPSTDVDATSTPFGSSDMEVIESFISSLNRLSSSGLIKHLINHFDYDGFSKSIRGS